MGPVDPNGLDASWVLGRLEGRHWTSPTTCKLPPKPSLPIKISSVTQNMLVKDQVLCFDAVVNPVALFRCGHRTVHQKDLHQLDVACRIFLRAVVGPPANIDWSRPWHDIVHDWNGKVQSVTLEHGMKFWSHRSVAYYLPIHPASVPHDKWIQRILTWMPDARHTTGCPRRNWATKLSAFVRFLQMDDWQILAQHPTLWLHLTEDFIQFCKR